MSTRIAHNAILCQHQSIIGNPRLLSQPLFRVLLTRSHFLNFFVREPQGYDYHRQQCSDMVNQCITEVLHSGFAIIITHNLDIFWNFDDGT